MDSQDTPYPHREDRFAEIARAAFKAAPPSREIVSTLNAILTAAAACEPAMQVPCEHERKLLAELQAFAEHHRIGHATFAQFFVTRTLTRLRYDRFALYNPSLALGVGDGLSTAFALGNRRMSIGSDFTDHDVETARQAGCFDRVMKVDMQAIPFPDGHFKTVTADNAVYHATDKGRALEEIARVTAPGGEAHFDDLAAAYFTTKPLAELFRSVGLPRAAHAVTHAQARGQATWTADECRDRLKGLGFSSVEVRPVFSPQLFHAAYWTFDLLGILNSSPDSTVGLGEYLSALVAPLIAQDERLCAEHGGVMWSVSARKREG